MVRQRQQGGATNVEAHRPGPAAPAGRAGRRGGDHHGATPAPAAPSVDDPGTFVFPANGPITSAFGRRWGRAHTGVDIDGATGSPIIAAQTGTVTLAGWKNGYGNTVMIDHGNGVTTLYAHQARISVRNGQRVDRGQVLGTVGSTGNVTAAHLHYEVIVDGVHRNPAPWLR